VPLWVITIRDYGLCTRARRWKTVFWNMSTRHWTSERNATMFNTIEEATTQQYSLNFDLSRNTPFGAVTRAKVRKSRFQTRPELDLKTGKLRRKPRPTPTLWAKIVRGIGV
jgi:hypothetical protein